MCESEPWSKECGEKHTFSPSGSGLCPFQENAATIFTIAKHRSQAKIRAETLQGKRGLNCRARL